MDSLYILAAQLAINPYFDGQGQTFEIAGELQLPDNAVIRNATFKQIAAAPGIATRSLWKFGGGPVTLDNVKIDRGPNKLAGLMGSGAPGSTSAGLHLVGVADARIDVEVTGHGRGAGVYIQDCTSFHPDNSINVHDMCFEHVGSTVGMYEQLIGIWINYFDTSWNSRLHLNSPQVKRITSRINGVDRAYQTDGITLGGTYFSSISNPQIEDVGEGIDATGSMGNSGLDISGGYVLRADSFGVKMACSAQFARVHDMNIAHCGWSAVVVSGQMVNSGPIPNDIVVHHVNAFDTGSNGNWAASNIAAFAIMNNSTINPTYPRDVVFESCLARSFGSGMKYGYRNENSHLSNRKINCRSIGHTVSENLGVFG